jgi:hypothetical protein
MSGHGNQFGGGGELLEQSLHLRTHHEGEKVAEMMKAAAAKQAAIQDFRKIVQIAVPESLMQDEELPELNIQQLVEKVQSSTFERQLTVIVAWLTVQNQPQDVLQLSLVSSYRSPSVAVQAFKDGTLEQICLELFIEALQNEKAALEFSANKLERRAEMLEGAGNTGLAASATLLMVNPPAAAVAFGGGVFSWLASAIVKNMAENKPTDDVDRALALVNSTIRRLEQGEGFETLQGWAEYERPRLS